MATQSVLVLEDQETIRLPLVKALESAGITVFAAGTVAEARKLLETHVVDVFVSDLLLPDESGVDLLKSAKANPKIDLSKTKIIILTTWDDSSVLDEALDPGTYEFIRKDSAPLDDIVERVQHALDES